ncbi:hypothetical protein N7456_006456 [Penicillium angulare]|uniref:C2H2-type domain-containing protein n=1 Tax=Penicillium angulare TaxID=116970 RepID=A0A9W9FHU1_9EURO|nr:hypothetical protein N7456_006456 [Penicillium angulare]
MDCGKSRDVNPFFYYTSATPENNHGLSHNLLRPDDPSLYSLGASYAASAQVQQPNSSNILPRYFFEDNVVDLEAPLYGPSTAIDLQGNGSYHMKSVVAGGEYMLPTIPYEKGEPHNGRVGQEGISHQASQLGLGTAATAHLLEDHAPDSSDLKSDSRPFRCAWKDCGYNRGFTRKGSLLRHVKSLHLDPHSFVCPVEACSKNFSRKDNLNEHIRRKH